MADDASPSQITQNPYKGFLAGVFSGIAKQTVGHPFDTIKVRLQTSSTSRFNGPLDCLMKTIRGEGLRGLYKGATPPLVGWMFMDSIMLGSLSNYRRIIKDNFYASHQALPVFGHACAGVLAGWTVSFVAAPVENVKARLQVQYHDVRKAGLLHHGKPLPGVKYTGPIDCITKLVREHGLRGLFNGLFATMVFRSYFFFWWGSYSLFTNELKKRTALSDPMINFWAGGLSAQVFWVTCYPADVVKQRVMTGEIGKVKWSEEARKLWSQGRREIWRGFLPCFLRSFPANACALVAFESVMRMM
ncbi:mitochondrial carrier [Ascobolus immersus RN42]|uniref:Mitochondrial carrier n=1 Tax=Ascobolus immersus RN42 TaxID=1160509 RepID=A0A3N4IHQ9_ASCIM|nr:mitochondrial carrier [Ascobolus immersus RN42]